MLATLLGIDEKLVSRCLKSDLYLKVLAIDKNKTDLLSALGGKIPFVMRKRDADELSGVAAECFEKDVFANEIYNLAAKTKTNEFYSLLV